MHDPGKHFTKRLYISICLLQRNAELILDSFRALVRKEGIKSNKIKNNNKKGGSKRVLQTNKKGREIIIVIANIFVCLYPTDHNNQPNHTPVGTGYHNKAFLQFGVLLHSQHSHPDPLGT